MDIINKLKSIFKDKDFDDKTTETKVLNKIDGLLEEGPIDNISSRDEFIKYIFRTYYYKNQYRPFVSYLEIIYKYYLIFLIFILIGLSTWGGIGFYFDGYIDSEFSEFSKHVDKYKNLWIITANIAYFSFVFYIIIRIYSYIRKLIRKEVKKNFLKTFGIGFLKVILFYILIASSWFIGQFFGSLINIVGFAIPMTIEEVVCGDEEKLIIQDESFVEKKDGEEISTDEVKNKIEILRNNLK